MKLEEVKRTWIKVRDLSNYHKRLQSISIIDTAKGNKPVRVDFNSGITAICGKNGAGKSSFIKSLYNQLTDNRVPHARENTEITDIIIKDKDDNTVDAQQVSKAVILEPFSIYQRIDEFLKTTSNVEELMEGVEYNSSLNGEKIRAEVSNVIGKSYSKIHVYEIEDVFPDDETFILPIFQVETSSGLSYSNASMGTGEFICIYMFWFLSWIEKETILLVDELENSISAYSQKNLLDYMAKISYVKGLWCIITTHSEHILRKVGLDNVRVLSDLPGKGTHIVKPEHQIKYLNSLGVGNEPTGAVVLEDSCALVFCKELLNKFNPYFLKEKELVGVGGESNIEKLIRHFKPHKEINYDFFAVFDADMSTRLSKLQGTHVKSIVLPSSSLLNPDSEMWDTLLTNIYEISVFLGISEDILIESIDNHSAKDHHERLISICDDINVTIDRIRTTIIKRWIELNPIAAAEFSLTVMAFGKKVDKESMVSIINVMECHSKLDLTPLKLKVKNAKENFERLHFDGVELEMV